MESRRRDAGHNNARPPGQEYLKFQSTACRTRRGRPARTGATSRMSRLALLPRKRCASGPVDRLERFVVHRYGAHGPTSTYTAARVDGRAVGGSYLAEVVFDPSA
jgi:hypothetical protein